MGSNIDRYVKDLDSLVARGKTLGLSMSMECSPQEYEGALKAQDAKTQAFIKKLPPFADAYQSWYSEARALIRQILPDRLSDFVHHYEKPRPRRNITSENYRIEDYLQGVVVTSDAWDHAELAGPKAAIPHFRQQRAILESARARFRTSLFDIRQLVRADLFDSELDAAGELAKHRFTRAAGAVAGVVLERHLSQVCRDRGVKLTKKSPHISDLNNALKDAGIIDVPQWRFIQHLADIRNLCDHNKPKVPTPEQAGDLIAGTRKTTKTLF